MELGKISRGFRLLRKLCDAFQKQPFADNFQNFSIVTGKHLCKKRLQQRYCLVNMSKFLKAAFYRTPLVSTSSITKININGDLQHS